MQIKNGNTQIFQVFPFQIDYTKFYLPLDPCPQVDGADERIEPDPLPIELLPLLLPDENPLPEEFPLLICGAGCLL